LAFDPVLAGTDTDTDTVALPPAHESVFGSPERVGDEENRQFFVAVTDAESWTDPPAWGSTVGVAVKEVIVVALAWATVVDLGTGTGLTTPVDLER
jgi:hypothetical protein